MFLFSYTIPCAFIASAQFFSIYADFKTLCILYVYYYLHLTQIISIYFQLTTQLTLEILFASYYNKHKEKQPPTKWLTSVSAI